MKNLSAKLKITMWTSLLMILISLIIVVLMLLFSDSIVKANSYSRLTEVVENNLRELEFDDGELDLDDVDLYINGVHTILYSQDGEPIVDKFPEDYGDELPLLNGQFSQIIIDSTLYYSYDELARVEDSSHLIWVRGIVSTDELTGVTDSVLQIAFIALPVFIIIGTLGCYFIVKFTFKPLDKILNTAEEISHSEDLSLRINLEGTSEELYHLASTFDFMLERLEEAFEAEKQFSQNVSHELRTPTAVILAQCEYALGHTANAEDKQEALQVIDKQAKRMSGLISQLLTLTRMERGIEKAEFTTLNFSELVKITCEEHDAFATRDIKMNFDIAPNIMMSANPTMMIRLVTNLLTNAYRYGKDGGNIFVGLSESESHIVLSVRDDGIGIAPEHKAKIFRRFFRVDSARSHDANHSMGLGLSMVWQIAKIHKAQVDLVSEIGEGSTFTVRFEKK